ncbi:MAG: extracellular solute-binding protein [Bacteroidales bacterium]|nr:extracellular solute-binding protein [Bacteroidales bacterium]
MIIFHAGSLSLPIKAMSDAFMRMHPKVRILSEGAGSLDCARKITDLRRPCDIIASADYVVIDRLIVPKFASENRPFARNEMALVHTSKSRFAHEINSDNWKEIILRPQVYIGRSDPDADPCGYRTLLTLKLAGCEQEVKAKKNQFMRPKEVDLLALLESGSVDYIFLYKSVAIQHGLPYVALSDSINLSNVALAQHYASVGMYVRGNTPSDSLYMEGAPMVYSFAVLDNAPNPKVAKAFADFMSDPRGGLAIMEQMGQTPIEQQ